MPYRNSAYFGFRSAMNVPFVQHFHIPTIQSDYVRRSRSTSLNDIFATERYLSMSNDSLNRVMRTKLNFDRKQLGTIHHYHNNSIYDFYYMKMKERFNNLERLSEVCDDHLRNIHYYNMKSKSDFLEKLNCLQYSEPNTAESIHNAAESIFAMKLDHIDHKILEKINYYLRTYGNLPELYHRIGEQILNRRNYEDIDVCSSKVTCAQIDNLNNDKNNIDMETSFAKFNYPQLNELFMRQFHKPQRILLNKSKRNRNFVLENIEKVKKNKLQTMNITTKNKTHENTANAAKKSISSSSRKLVPAGKASCSSQKFRRQNLKRRSLQFTIDEEHENLEMCSSNNGHDVPQNEQLKQICKDQGEFITEMSGMLNKINDSVIQIVQLQEEIGATQSNHKETASLMTMHICERVKNTFFDAIE
ncbi:uncharacterized protein LOC131432830 [Malaya genurostris]|uniref:uncharacterized protein LOC131432830 n=1 Tax=Malaya genurostris TaxID=325434 RepID=UPI0026F390EE|nr:uncharacterized protein LOC131432830 [Malaya genurostris]